MLSKAFLKEVEAIHRDTKSGAAKIAEECLSALKQESLRIIADLDSPTLKTAIQLLLDTHPMATIENALLPIYVRLTQLLESGKLKLGDPKATINLVFSTHLNQLRICEKATIQTLVNHLEKRDSLLTFSHSSTVIKALLQLAREGFKDKEIFVLESRPLNEGERTAHSLANVGFKKVHLGIDFAVNEFAEKSETAVFGADMVHSNGQILNKIGSATIGKLFYMQSKEVIVAASSSKICLRGIINQNEAWHPVISHRNSSEVSSISGPNLLVWNKYFEIIQPEFITSLIMDQHHFPAPITENFEAFLKNEAFSKRIEEIRKLWYDVDFTLV
ncbi:MAG: hypothetical protein ACFFAJ_01485 [Candidatus Hodarchaeota archaeon]